MITPDGHEEFLAGCDRLRPGLPIVAFTALASTTERDQNRPGIVNHDADPLPLSRRSDMDTGRISWLRSFRDGPTRTFSHGFTSACRLRIDSAASFVGALLPSCFMDDTGNLAQPARKMVIRLRQIPSIALRAEPVSSLDLSELPTLLRSAIRAW